MRSEFDELKRFAIADVLSVSGKEKTTSTIEKHIDNIIDVAIAIEQNQQSKVDELQKRVDAALQLVNEMKGKRYPFSAYADQLEQALKGVLDE